MLCDPGTVNVCQSVIVPHWPNPFATKKEWMNFMAGVQNIWKESHVKFYLQWRRHRKHSGMGLIAQSYPPPCYSMKPHQRRLLCMLLWEGVIGQRLGYFLLTLVDCLIATPLCSWHKSKERAGRKMAAKSQHVQLPPVLPSLPNTLSVSFPDFWSYCCCCCMCHASHHFFVAAWQHVTAVQHLCHWKETTLLFWQWKACAEVYWGFFPSQACHDIM